MESRPSLYEYAGGRAAFERLARAHHRRCLADPVLQHPFSRGIHPQHATRLAMYWAEVMGGPPLYSETCADQMYMLRLHAHTNAEADLGRRFVECFVAAADDAGLPAAAPFRRALRKYMEWAVLEVMSYAPAGSELPPGAVVPRWDWDGLVEI